MKKTLALAFGFILTSGVLLALADPSELDDITKVLNNTFSLSLDNIIIQPQPLNADMSGVINSALVSFADVKLACGTFHVNNSIAQTSHTWFHGSGGCTHLVSAVGLTHSAQWTSVGNPNAHIILSNQDFINGNTDMKLSDMDISFPGDTLSGTYFDVSYYNASFVQVWNVTVSAAGVTNSDGIAFTQSSHYSVDHSYVSNVTNACFDNWQGNDQFSITNNECAGGGTDRYGILVNGLGGTNAGSPPLTTQHGVIAGNRITSVQVIGIGVYGLNIGPIVGAVAHIAVENNIIDGVSLDFGIEFGDGFDLTAIGNHISNTGAVGIEVISPTSGFSDTIKIDSNVIDGVSQAAPEVNSAIEVANAASNISIGPNSIKGTTHKYAIRIFSGTTNTTVQASNLAPGGAVAANAFLLNANYQIVSVGTTDFTLLGASSNTVGVVFKANATGTGTGTGTARNVGNSTVAILDAGTNSSITHIVNGVSYQNGKALNGPATSWTPVVSFGGAHVGVTYSTQNGQYWQNGTSVLACAQIVLTSKGSSTGNATIDGLPLVAFAIPAPFTPTFTANFSGISPPAPFMELPASGGTSIRLFTDNHLGTAVADTNFANTTNLSFCGTYAAP